MLSKYTSNFEAYKDFSNPSKYWVETMEAPWIGKRRLYRMGDGGLAILLPKSWATSQKLGAGDEVLVVADGRLVIEPVTSKRIQQAHEVVASFAMSGEKKSKDR